MSIYRKLKVNKPVRDHLKKERKANDIIKIKCDEKGTPLERKYRDLLKDAKIDGCVEWAEESENQ